MGPKSAPVGAVPVIERVDGAQFSRMLIGLKDRPKEILVNNNCPVEIMCDFMKRESIIFVESEIQLLVASLQQSHLQAQVQEPPLEASIEPEALLLEKFRSIQADLYSDTTIFEFQNLVTGTAVNFSKNTMKLGTDPDMFSGGVPYAFGKDEQGVFNPFLFDDPNKPAEAPVAEAVGKKK